MAITCSSPKIIIIIITKPCDVSGCQKELKSQGPHLSLSLFCSDCASDHGVDDADHIPVDTPLSSVLQMICAHSLCLTDLKTLLWVLETLRLIPVHLGFTLGLGCSVRALKGQSGEPN